MAMSFYDLPTYKMTRGVYVWVYAMNEGLLPQPISR